MQFEPQKEEKPEDVALKLTRDIYLSPGLKYKNDQDRQKAINKMAKEGTSVTSINDNSVPFQLRNEKSGIELSVKDAWTQFYFEYRNDGSFVRSWRLNIRPEVDGCTRLIRVGLPDDEARDIGDQILRKMANFGKNNVLKREKVLPPRPVCIPK